MLVTWNMQGSNARTELKWQTGVIPLLQQTGADVVCLQECGGVPESAQFVAYPTPDARFTLWSWGGTTSRPLAWILHFHWDTLGGRVNLALVGRASTPPAGIVALVPAAGPSWRPAIGAQVGGTAYFSLHAISPGGPDAQGLLAAVAAAVPGGNWVVAGDFNRGPGTLVVPVGATVRPPNGATYPARDPMAVYDYAVSGGAAAFPASGTVLMIDGHLSDHRPVNY